jgi:hypothetical protein
VFLADKVAEYYGPPFTRQDQIRHEASVKRLKSRAPGCRKHPAGKRKVIQAPAKLLRAI